MKELFGRFLIENPSFYHEIVFPDSVDVLRVLSRFHRWLVNRRKTARHMNDWPNKFMVRKWVVNLRTLHLQKLETVAH